MDEETQLKVTGSTPVKTDCDLPDHVNVFFVKTLEDVELPSETTVGLKQLLFDHRETFATSSADLGFCPLVQHDIDTGDARPIKQSPRRPPISARDAEDKILDEMLETGVIEPSNSSWRPQFVQSRRRMEVSDFVLTIGESMQYLKRMHIPSLTFRMFWTTLEAQPVFAPLIY